MVAKIVSQWKETHETVLQVSGPQRRSSAVFFEIYRLLFDVSFFLQIAFGTRIQPHSASVKTGTSSLPSPSDVSDDFANYTNSLVNEIIKTKRAQPPNSHFANIEI